jgi:hypothetical protein
MAELCRCPCLALKPLKVLCGRRAVAMGHLNGNDAIQPGIPRTPDGAKGAVPHTFKELKPAQ